MPHAERAHARLSPSGSKRWINCPGSIRMETGIPEVPSKYAAEGTAAHELAEKCLRHGYNSSRYVGKEINGWSVTVGMAEAVQIYLDYCRSRINVTVNGKPWLNKYLLEQRVEIGVIEDGGTADMIVYDEHSFTLEVIDYKHGVGVPVEAEDNTQGLLYALGALKEFSGSFIDKVKVTIVQPRCHHPEGPIRSWEIDYDEVIEWNFKLYDAVLAAKDPNALLNPGDWCKFCRAAHLCPKLRERALRSAQDDFGAVEVGNLPDPAKMTPAELAALLDDIPFVEAWVKAVKEFAHNEAVSGRIPPGRKLVATRATRQWVWPEDTVVRELVACGVEEDKLFTAPELLSVAQVEKAVGKAKFSKVLVEINKSLTEGDAPIIAKVSSGVTLVSENDPRPPVKANASDEFSIV